VLVRLGDPEREATVRPYRQRHGAWSVDRCTRSGTRFVTCDSGDFESEPVQQLLDVDVIDW